MLAKPFSGLANSPKRQKYTARLFGEQYTGWDGSHQSLAFTFAGGMRTCGL
jgi:hypothetical protein